MTAVPVSSAAFSIMPTKESAPCCIAARDSLGRPPIGYCGPGCLRSLARRLLAEYHDRLTSAEREWRRMPLSLDYYHGRSKADGPTQWEPTSTEWDDPTSEAALR